MAETFSLRNRALKLNTADDLTPHLPPLLASPTNITTLDLSGNTLGVPASLALASYIPSLTNLHTANLGDIFTGRLLAEIPPALDALLKALLQCPKLETVNLNDNAFGLNTVEPLRPFLSQHVPLRHLYLNNNGLGPAAGTLVAQALETLAEKKSEARKAGRADVPDLETVVCGRNRLENGSMEAWAKAYTAHGSGVRVVKMVQNGIRQEGIAHLLRHGLGNCGELRVLDLQDNTFTSLAGKTLASVLPGSWSKIVDLGVGDCLLGARGGVMLGNALAEGKNTAVEVLRLQYNEIDAKGVEAIVGAAVSGSAMPRLRRVELNGNKFSEEDQNVEKLQELLSERKDKKAGDYEGVDEDDEDAWGVDELDELEDDDDDEEEEGADEEDAEEESVVKEADQAEQQPVAQVKDKEVDELADALGKTALK